MKANYKLKILIVLLIVSSLYELVWLHRIVS